MVELTGSGLWWGQLGWGCGGVDRLDHFLILILISDDEVRYKLGRSIRRLVSHGGANHW